MKKEEKKYKVGIVIGRFQPFHKGHAYLIHKALENIDKIIINIGSANILDGKNPFTFEQRKRMVEEFIRKEGIENRILRIVATDDIPDNDKWVRDTIAACGKADVVVSNNDSGVNVFFEKMGKKIFRVPFYKRYLLEGTKIRELMRAGKEWEKRVPPFLLNLITNPYEQKTNN